MTAAQLARLLRPYGIESRTVRIGAGTSKGAGVTPLGDVTTSQARESRENDVTPGPECDVTESPGVTQKLLELQGCDGVTAAASPRRPGYARIEDGPYAGFFMARDGAGKGCREPEQGDE